MYPIVMQSADGDEQSSGRRFNDRGPVAELLIYAWECIESVFRAINKCFHRKQPVLRKAVELTREVKIILAKDSGTCHSLLEQLSRDSDPQIRLEVVFNRSLPHTILTSLSNDSDKFVAAQALVKLSGCQPRA